MILVDYQVVGAAAGAYLALFTYKWALGRRAEAFFELENLANVLVGILILQFVFSVAEQVAGLIGVPFGAGAEAVSSALVDASEKLAALARAAKDQIISFQAIRAALALVPVIGPLASVLGAASSWAMSLLGIEATFFLTLSVSAKAFSYVAPWLAAVGAAVFPVPRLRRMGASFLATYLATSIAFLYCGAIAGSVNVSQPPQQGSITSWERAVPLLNAVVNTAENLLDAMVKCGVVLALAAVAGYGFASVFEGTYVSLAHV